MNQISALTVSQVNNYIRTILEGKPELDGIYVKGEISNFTRQSSGHLYFTLKDTESQLKSVMFRGNAMHLRFSPENGMSVIAHGRISVYTVSGQYQLYVDDIQPDGLGSLALQFEQTKKKLEAEGLFSPERKKKLPDYPKTVGIITSPTGAAIHDIIKTMNLRAPYVKLLLFPSLVQGEGAVENLILGLRFFDVTKLADVIIIGRGGGSVEDLWAFNSEALARAIANCTIPVISAVGHESDFSISDFTADARAATPTAGASLACRGKEETKELLRSYAKRMEKDIGKRLDESRDMLDRLASTRELAKPERMTEQFELSLGNAEAEFRNAFTTAMENKQRQLDTQIATLEALSPLKIMQRGYAVLSDENDKPIRSVSQLHPTDSVRLRLSDGERNAVITK